MSQSTELPELPLPSAFGIGNTRYYNADQMRAYAELAIASVKREPLSDAEITELDLPGMMYVDIVRKIEQAHGIGAPVKDSLTPASEEGANAD